jgi:transposase-like protein
VVKAVADRHDVHANLLHHWRRQVRQAAGRKVNFLPVSMPADRKPAADGGLIEIELGNVVRVRVDGGVDEAAFGRVLRALSR